MPHHWVFSSFWGYYNWISSWNFSHAS